MNDAVTVSLDQTPWQRYWNFGPKPVFTWFSVIHLAGGIRTDFPTQQHILQKIVTF
jgi:hypothetical protein